MDSQTFSVEEPVTALIVRTIKTAKEKEYENWLAEMCEMAGGFQGFQGVSTIKPREVSRENILIVRFDDYDHLRKYRDSPQRLGYLKKSGDFVNGEMAVHEMQGHETFFSLPAQSKAVAAPPKYKTMLLTMLALYPPLVLITAFTAKLLPKLSRPLLQLLVVLIIVPLMTYFLVPWINRLFRFWLVPKGK